MFEQSSDGYFYNEAGELRKEVREDELTTAGVPLAYSRNKAALDEPAIEFMKVWLEEWKRGGHKPDRNFFIFGDPKKTISFFTKAIRNVAHRCFPVMAISAVDLAEQARDVEKLHKLASVSCLGIYDFGLQHRDKDGYYDQFFIKILSARSNGLLPTLILSPYSTEELKKVVFLQIVNPLPDQVTKALASRNIINIIERSFEEVTL